MIRGGKIQFTDEPEAGATPTRHKYGTNMDWLECDAETFINYWLPIFDKQNGIDAPISIDEPYKPLRAAAQKRAIEKPVLRRKINNVERIKALVSKTPMTLAEIAKALDLGSPATAHKAIVNNPSFCVVAEKRVGKNPYVKVWGVR